MQIITAKLNVHTKSQNLTAIIHNGFTVQFDLKFTHQYTQIKMSKE